MSSNRHKTLTRDLQFYYWLGFILADGHISNGRLIVQLHDKDLGHLEKLSYYFDIPKPTKVKDKHRHHSRISYMNKHLFDNLCIEFGISNQKTVSPPDTNLYDKLTHEELLSVFAGFIDGDGCIGTLTKRPDFHLRIKCHGNWYLFLSYLNERLCLGGSCKINKQGYVLFTITNTATLKELKRSVLKLHIPILQRKWNVVDFNFVGRNEVSEYRKKTVEQMYCAGSKIKNIADFLKVNSSTVSQIIKRNNLKNEN